MSETVIGQNFYLIDTPLREQLDRRIHPDVRAWAEKAAKEWGQLCGGPVAERAEIIDKNPPRLEGYDRWGRSVNRVVHHASSLATKRDLCEAGYTGFGWTDEVRSDPKKRHAAAILNQVFSYLLNQSDTGMACACGMTGGVARVLDLFADEEIKEEFLPHLTTMDFDYLWDGSMFMTERSGGSDLSNTETTATKDGQLWLLEGEKWFCSNVDGKAILTLARPEGAGSGTKGLGLYLVPRFLEDGSLNSIHIRRIKDKLGTRSVPTGEVIYERAVGYQIGEPGFGINRMMEMVNVSRLGVAVMGAGIARRTFLEAVNYSREREAFGRTIRDYPMVRETLVDMQVESEAAVVMCVESADVAGRVAAGTDAELLSYLRILVPLAKIRAARTGLLNAIEAVEIHGGNGYIEDWPTARQLRDAQCHTIWEGTENINSLDVLRAMVKSSAHEALMRRVDEVIESVDQELASPLADARANLPRWIEAVTADHETHAKRFANRLCDLSAAALLAESAANSERATLVAKRYIQTHLADRDPLHSESNLFLEDSIFESIVDGAAAFN
jgi:alkylation response protein AidB-like acyl-CoA dehydrogenase